MAAIETSALTKYYGKARGIIGMDLEVREGEVFGFVGPNGAGKTTTIRLLLSLIHPTRGRAAIFGTPVLPGGGEVYRQVGYVPAEVSYYREMTGDEVLDYAASFHPGADPAWRRSLMEMKVIIFRLAGDAAPEGPVLEGWPEPVPVEGRPGYYRLSVQEPVNRIVGRLAELDLADLRIADPSLEDLFMTMYGPGQEGGPENVQS